MRVVLALVVPLGAALLQVSLASLLAIGDVHPRLTVLVAASWAVAAGAREAVWWAFIGGLASDLLSGGPLGALPLATLPAVAAVGLGDPTRPAGVGAAAVAVGVATFVAALLYVGVLALGGQPLPSIMGLTADALGGAAYTGALALAAYPLLRMIRRITERQGAFGA